jgi:glycosyltransferase involved in cell wall biosynthesis
MMREEKKKTTVSIIGPSDRFLSGISYYTTRLSNALTSKYTVQALLFRHMLPTFLFPGASRVGSSLSTLTYEEDVTVHEIVDWYNPLTWYRAYTHAARGDICILEWWTSSVSHMYLCIALLLRLRKIPIIMEFHEVVDPLEDAILPIRIYSRLMGRMIRGLCTRYVVHSAHDQALIAEKYGIEVRKIEIIPHGLYDQYPLLPREEAQKHLDIPSDISTVFLFFGLIRPYKGISQLIRAFENLPAAEREHSLLLIAGEAWEDQHSIARAKESPEWDRIKLYPTYISDDEVPYFFSAADVLVLPYTRASQSGVAHIGISYGMPIIATHVGGLVESLSKYEGTQFVPPEDEHNLTKALASIIHQKRSKTYDVPLSLRWDGVAIRWVDMIMNINSGK